MHVACWTISWSLRGGIYISELCSHVTSDIDSMTHSTIVRYSFEKKRQALSSSKSIPKCLARRSTVQTVHFCCSPRAIHKQQLLCLLDCFSSLCHRHILVSVRCILCSDLFFALSGLPSSPLRSGSPLTLCVKRLPILSRGVFVLLLLLLLSFIPHVILVRGS